MTRISKSKSRRGAEMLEFTLAFLPLLAMTTVLIDIAWGIYAKTTLAYAVHAGLRVGITTTGDQAKTGGLGGDGIRPDHHGQASSAEQRARVASGSLRTGQNPGALLSA